MPRLLRSEQEKSFVKEQGPEYLELLARGLRVLTAFTADKRQMTLSEVAVVVNLSRATARRALHTLERLGYVETDGKLYRLMPRVMTLASAYLSSNGISIVAQPVVERVCRQIGETCSVGILDRTEVVFVARASPRRIISVDLTVGYRLPAYATGIGRVLLGGLDPDELEALLDQTELAKLTSRTTVDKTLLKAAVIATRETGQCIVDEEAEVGLRSAAVPVRRYDGKIACALQVGVRTEQVSVDRLRDDILPVMKEAAGEIGQMIV